MSAWLFGAELGVNGHLVVCTVSLQVAVGLCFLALWVLWMRGEQSVAARVAGLHALGSR